MARHVQITWNNKFAISLQYHKKEVNDEVDFLHAEKHEGFLKINTMILIGMIKHSQSSQNRKSVYLYNILKKKKSEMKFFACRYTSNFPISWIQYFGHESFLQGITIINDGHEQDSLGTQSNKFAISLQYLQKEVRDGVQFLHYWKWPDMFKKPKRGSW